MRTNLSLTVIFYVLFVLFFCVKRGVETFCVWGENANYRTTFFKCLTLKKIFFSVRFLAQLYSMQWMRDVSESISNEKKNKNNKYLKVYIYRGIRLDWICHSTGNSQYLILSKISPIPGHSFVSSTFERFIFSFQFKNVCCCSLTLVDTEINMISRHIFTISKCLVNTSWAPENNVWILFNDV